MSLAACLAEHHRQCDRLFAAARRAAAAADWPGYARQLAALAEALDRHFEFEEGALFPAFEQAGGPRGGSTQAMREEHAEMRALIEALGAAAPRLDPEGCRAELERLWTLHAQHNAREEAVLYPACERLLGERAELLASARALVSPAPPDAPRELDVRGLEPPEPFVRILEELRQSPARPLRVLIHREPLPLYEALRELGFRCRAQPREGGGFEILIERG
ncbi:MAG: hemerythrin domain-containing protein [Betaproteobacteria bacterium]|nr:hemerythrin domain-containing protein [Betaproteobacteria bacterium]